MRLLIAALIFVLIVTPTFALPIPEKPHVIHHELTRAPEYKPTNIVYLDDHTGYVEFDSHRAFFYILGSGEEKALFLPGYGGTGKDFYEGLKEIDIPFKLIIIDPPGMGNSDGLPQTRENLIGNGSIKGSYFYRYTRYAYEVAKAFDVDYVIGASLGGITTFLVGYFMPSLKAIVPIMSSGYRKYSISRATAMNRFLRDDADRLIDAFDIAVFAPFIKVKTHMIVGAEDEIFDPYTFYRTYQDLTCEKSIAFIPEVGHGMFIAYVDALLARYYASEETGERVFYIGYHELTTSVPTYAFGLKVVTHFNAYGAYKSEIYEYKNYFLLGLYALIEILALAYLYFFVRERRLYVYVSALGFLPRVFSPGRFSALTVPALPLFFILAALAYTLVLVRSRLGIALSYFVRLFVGILMQVAIYPGPFLTIAIVAVLVEYIKTRPA